MYRSTRQDISHSYLVMMVATLLSLLLYATRFCVNLLGSAHDFSMMIHLSTAEREDVYFASNKDETSTMHKSCPLKQSLYVVQCDAYASTFSDGVKLASSSQ